MNITTEYEFKFNTNIVWTTVEKNNSEFKVLLDERERAIFLGMMCKEYLQ